MTSAINLDEHVKTGLVQESFTPVMQAEESEVKKFLNVNQVNKTYPRRGKEDLLVLDNINFTAEKNRICILLGPSGCGKSTLLRLVAGLDQCSSGDIFINDAKVQGPGRDRGMVFQSYTCFPWLTVLQMCNMV